MKNIVSTEVLFIALLFLFFSCSQKEESSVLLPELAHAESIMYQHPDSALKILEQMAVPPASDRLQNATWCLLMTQAKYKNFIDQPSDSLINIAHEYFMERDDPQRKALVLYFKGVLNEEWGKTEDALNYYMGAAKNIGGSDDHKLCYLIYIGIGGINAYRNLETYAMGAYLEANQYAELSGNKTYISASLSYIARVYGVRKEWNKSIKYYKEALEVAKSTADTKMISSVLCELSSVYCKLKEYEQALNYIQESLHLSSGKKNHGIEQIFLIIGDIYYSTGENDSAYYYLNKAVLTDNIYTKSGAYQRLYNMNKAEMNCVKAFEYSDKFMVYIDSIRKMDKSKAIIGVQEKYDREKLINEKIQLKIEKDRTTRDALWGLIFLLGIIAVLIYVYQRKVVKRERTIQANEEQIRRYTLKMHENEALIGRNESRIEGLISEIEQNQGIQEQLEELQKAKTLIEQSNEQLRKENIEFQDSICHYSTALQEKAKLLDFVKALSDDNQRLRDREKFLCEQLIRQTDILNKLKKTPKYLDEKHWGLVQEAIDLLYDKFTHRLCKNLPSITEVDLKVCCLIKLHISVSDMSTILAIEPGSVSKNKQRLKEHIIKDLGKPFSKNQTVDLWIWEY